MFRETIMTLSNFTQHWQALLDRHPVRSKGWVQNRFDEVALYRSHEDVYFMPALCDESGIANYPGKSEEPNNSGFSSVTASELRKYAGDRLGAIDSLISHSWNCEAFRDQDGTFVFSVFNRMGARFTIHGIQMTKNWCGVVSDRGVIVQC